MMNAMVLMDFDGTITPISDETPDSPYGEYWIGGVDCIIRDNVLDMLTVLDMENVNMQWITARGSDALFFVEETSGLIPEFPIAGMNPDMQTKADRVRDLAGVVVKPGVVVVCEDEPDVRASIIEAVAEIFPEAEIVAPEIDGDYGLTQEDIDLIRQATGL